MNTGKNCRDKCIYFLKSKCHCLFNGIGCLWRKARDFSSKK